MIKNFILLFALFQILSTTTVYGSVPVSTVMEEREGRQFLIQTYELQPNEDPSELIQEPFWLDGFLYAQYNISKEEIPVRETSQYEEIITTQSAGNDISEIWGLLKQEIDYSDKNGFSGKLSLDLNSVSTEVEGYTTNTIQVTDTKTIAGLERNDPSAISQTATKNGVQLKLKDISWTAHETSTVDYIPLPTKYTATAYYAGSYTQKVPTGYITTAAYSGEIAKEYKEKIIYTVTYLGEDLNPAEPDPVAEVEESSEIQKANVSPTALIIIASAVIIASGIIIYYRTNAVIYRKDGDDYARIALKHLSASDPILDLRKYPWEPKQEIAVLLKKRVAKNLFGRQVHNILSDDIEIKCLVDSKPGDYWYLIKVPEFKEVTITEEPKEE